MTRRPKRSVPHAGMTAADLQAWREAMRLTQDELAEFLGAEGERRERTIQDWEHGRREFPPYLWRALRDIERERGA